MILIASPGGTREKGGIGRVVDTIATELRNRRPDLAVRVLDTYGPGSFQAMPLWFLAALVRLAGYGLTGAASVIHVHMAERGSVARKGALMALARALRVPVVLHLHAGQLHEQVAAAGVWERRAIAAAIGLADEVVVLGRFHRDFVATTFPRGGRRVTVLPNAVPGPIKAPIRPVRKTTRLLFLGRIVPVKGLPVLFKALSSPELIKRDWILRLVGDGERERHEIMVRECGLEDRVTFTGWQSQADCRRELAEADVLVQPSFAEGLPMAILEAMAYGLAIVATPVGSVGDALSHETSGLLVPPRDAGALAQALARAIDDPALRVRLGERARADYERSYNLDAFMDGLLSIYRRNARRWPDTILAGS